MENDSSAVRTSPVPELARKQVERLEAVVAELRADSLASKEADQRQYRLWLIPFAIATAKLIAAIVQLIHSW